MQIMLKVSTVNGEEIAFVRNPSGSVDVSRVHRGSRTFNTVEGSVSTIPGSEGQPFDEKITTIKQENVSKVAAFFAQLP